MKIESRKDVIKYAKMVDDDFRSEENVIYAEKVFMFNNVVNWCYNQLESKRMKPSEMDFYLQALTAFMKEECDIYWDEMGNLVIS